MKTPIVKLTASAVLVSALGLMAWPVADEPNEAALEFVDTAKTDWTGQRPSWVGNDAKRNAILISAVWSGNAQRSGAMH